MSRSSRAVRWVAPVFDRTGASGGGGRLHPAHTNLLQLQRHAGNRAVADLLSGRSAVQRHKGTEPEIAAAHVLTPAETKELPTVADTPKLLKEQADLRAERKALQDKAKAAKAPPAPADVTRTKEIDDRLAVIAKGLALRTSKGDEDETLVRNGITGGAAAWFAEVHTMTFLGKPATVHSSLEKRLKKAEDALKSQPPPKDGWVREGHSTLRPPGQGLHSYGLAIDLNPHTNPFLVDPDNAYAYLYEGAAASKAIRDVIGRAVLLVLGRTAAEERFFVEGTEKDKNARVAASYDKLAEASDAVERYLGLAAAAKKPELEGLVTALGKKNPANRSADDWAKLIVADGKTLTARAATKSWDKPETGFLDLDKRLVVAMTDSAGAAITWLGDDTVASGRDIMHFDTRGAGPIKKVWSSVLGRDTYLGDG